MFNIEYDIGLTDYGRPCIELAENHEHKPEDKFFAIEVARYILQEVFSRRSPELDEYTGEIMENSINFLGQISDEMAEILYGQLKAQGEIQFLIDTRYHIIVNTIEERDALPEKDILSFNKIYDRRVGLKVYVIEDKNVYELTEGILNENWVKL